MAETVQRPTFHEGQIVGAADLTEAVDYNRDAIARHRRYQHTWGIVEGLELEEKKIQTNNEEYIEIYVRPGLAIDGTGRSVLVADERRLSEDDFLQMVPGATVGRWFPVFLVGRDDQGGGDSGSLAACGSGSASRIEETFDMQFGRSEDLLLDLEGQVPLEVGDGPGSGSTPWKIPLGFVQWDPAIGPGQFVRVADSAEGASRRYTGVRAAEVVASNQTLTLRAATANEDGKPAVVLDGSGDGKLVFGPQNSSGVIKPVMTVDSEGNLTIEGTLSSSLESGVYVTSGSVSDGALVPLPPGVTGEQVADGQAVLHVHVTPRYQGTTAAGERLRPIECRVDGRRVWCRVEWVDDVGAVTAAAGICDFTVLASVTSEDGGGA